MKKTLKTLAVASVAMITSGAMAGVTDNMENPLFIPRAGQVFSKTGAGLMYKKSDHTAALRDKGIAGDPEFPVYRFTEDFGYGFTDRATGYVSLGYTHNRDIDRTGMSRGRLGLNYRVFETTENFVWDMYGEGYLSGISPMKGVYDIDGFTYKNFSNGRWGAVLGTRVGKTWSKLTTSLFLEYLQTFGNHNNEIELRRFDLRERGAGIKTASDLGLPNEISVDLKSTHEITAGLNAFYQMSDCWSFGGGFRFVEHSDNGVKSLHTPMVDIPEPQATYRKMVIDELLKQTADMDDGWHEYIVSAVLANQITDSFQLSLVGEYTFDFSHPGSQNGTDVKAELGIRANVKF